MRDSAARGNRAYLEGNFIMTQRSTKSTAANKSLRTS
jgi:hypothetical protein